MLKEFQKVYSNDTIPVIRKGLETPNKPSSNKGSEKASKPPHGKGSKKASRAPLGRKRRAVTSDGFGLFSISLMNDAFVSQTMTKLGETLSHDKYSDISGYLIGASGKLADHFK